MKIQEALPTLTKKTLMIGILVLAVFYVAGLLWLFSQRLIYPYELDWVEGGMLTSVTEILKGHSLYVPPTISYVPLIYTPIYFYISALSAKILGASLFALRLVSVIALLASLMMIILIVVGETQSWFWGFVSAGLFAALYPATRFWFDLARVDSLFLLFFLIFVFALQRGNSLFWQVSAGVFASLAALTKQTGLTMCLPIVAVYFLLDWKHRWVLPLTTLLVCGGMNLAFILSSHGWYIYYCYGLLLSEPANGTTFAVFDFVKRFIVPNILFAVVLTILLFSFWSFRNSKKSLFLWLIIVVSTFATSFVVKGKIGSVDNALIPTFAIFSLFMGVAVPEILNALQTLPKRYYALSEICLYLLVFFQMTQVLYKPWRHAPSSNDYRDGAKALQFVRKFDGNVFLPNSAILLMAGKSTFAHPSAIWEVVHSRVESKGKALLEADIQKAIETHLFEALVVLPDTDYFPDLQKYYILDDSKYTLMDEDANAKAEIYILP